LECGVDRVTTIHVELVGYSVEFDGDAYTQIETTSMNPKGKCRSFEPMRLKRVAVSGLPRKTKRKKRSGR
jgi:hypothetical protein